MIWTTETIKRLLDLYLEHPVLWDAKLLPLYANSKDRESAMEHVVANLGVPNVTVEDIHRKYRSMRAAYRVEMRNIYAAKLRGFFYKPSLHWFPIFQEYMQQVEDSKKKKEVPNQIIRQRGTEEAKTSSKGEAKMRRREQLESQCRGSKEIEMDVKQELFSEEEEGYSSEESEDEFQSFADHIAEQLRSMSVHRAVMIQNQIQRLFTHDREIHELMEANGSNDEEQEDEMMVN